ncbi:PfkB family carbohydrate kinase [Dawidia soli]|uniref:Ribokinase n=1 Tax=Dawidia soli TaxID=2782352 RepID=A0AAP2GGQ0_9BACT|nr:PfkB family carbohydrate kinase [Dawidia soli]MBT1690832.1 ribokinase [Dawidia soli]
MFDICCIGHMTLDKVITPQTEHHMAGGTAFYFSNAIRSLDVQYQLVTAVGKTELPYVETLRAQGTAVAVLPSAHTVYFENKYTGNLDHRTQRVLQVADPFDVEPLLAVPARIYHLGPLLAHDMSTEVIRALARQGKVSLDVQGFLRKVEGQQVVPIDWADKRTALPYISMLKANEHEMEVLTGQSDPRTGARMLAEWGVSEVIITLGSRGSVLYHENTFYDIPAYVPRAVVDATGCGDTYMAGYLSQRILGKSLQEAGEFAAAMASLKVEAPGAFRGTADDVARVLVESVQTLPG